MLTVNCIIVIPDLEYHLPFVVNICSAPVGINFVDGSKPKEVDAALLSIPRAIRIVFITCSVFILS